MYSCWSMGSKTCTVVRAREGDPNPKVVSANIGNVPVVDKNERRLSLVGSRGSSNPDQQRAYINSLIQNASTIGGAGTERMREAGEQFFIVVRNSSGDVVKDTRVLMKIARIGVATKLLMTLSMGYMDILTDFLVAQSYYDVKDFSTAYATAGFAVFAIASQAMVTFFQYGKKPWKERFGRTFAALLGFAPLVEGFSLWTGKEDPDMLVSGPMMYAWTKGADIGLESIPESIIQVNGLLKQDYGDIKTIQIIGVISSIVSGAFIMMDGNFGFILSKYLSSPGVRLNGASSPPARS
ncbi:hypothetical protein TrLO_g11514 [Triparma laevis f. longispina]|uniref:Uncharacterized protein n=1 Tax=Triparma laevis f. longispina TaxID=1714387 RepID=A0A9W7CEJ6_9STRA|nr:hypothetical protein TrLO_g11514 [Triparma laevis f. longispina]